MITRPYVCAALVTALLGLLPACAERRVVLQDADGTTRYEYSCAAFQAQLETREDLRGLRHEIGRVAADARANKRLVFLGSLHAASRTGNLRETERLLVEYKCAHDLA